MKKQLLKGIALAIAASMVMVIASCGGNTQTGESTQSASTESGELREIRMYTIPDPQMSAAHVIAMERDFMKKRDLRLITHGFRQLRNLHL